MKLRNTIAAAILAAGMAFAGCGCSSEMTMEKLAHGAVVVQGESSKGNIGDITITDGDLIAVFEIKGYGTIKAKLFPEIAPIGVENFKQLAESGYYDGLTIHRVVEDFMFQGGSLNGNGTGGEALVEGGSFGLEVDLENARHFYGALCYANAMGQNSTQFYIVNNNESQDLSELNVDLMRSYEEQYEELAESADSEDAAEYYSFYANYYRTMAQASEASDEISDKYKQDGGTPSLDGNYTVFGQVYDGFDVILSISSVDVNDNGSGEVSKPAKDIIIKSVKVYEYTSE